VESLSSSSFYTGTVKLKRLYRLHLKKRKRLQLKQRRREMEKLESLNDFKLIKKFNT
jgi:hypothetical protein